MDTALQRIVARLDDYVANLINVADMSEADKKALKNHLFATATKS